MTEPVIAPFTPDQGFDKVAEQQLMRDAANRPGPGNCTLWPDCGCCTQSGPHACEGEVPR